MTSSPAAETKKPAPVKPAEGEACPNCGSFEPWGTASWCPDCGFYPALGGTSLRSAEEVEAKGRATFADWEDTQDAPANLIEAIPPWGWMAMSGALLILLANVGIRTLLPLKASHRTLITLLEFSVGTLIASLSHLTAYLFAACKSDKFGPFDFFMKPIEIWKPTFQKMPEGERRVCGMVWGTTAVFAALLVVAGFDYNSMFDDWGFETPEKAEPEGSGRIRRRAAGDEDLEDSVKKITGDLDLDEADAKPIETRCVILGYTLSPEGELMTLILGSAPRGRLAYVGLLSQADIPEEFQDEIRMELRKVKRLKSCYLKQGVPLSKANWVEPKILCKVEHKSWTTQYRLQQPKFIKLIDPEEEAKQKQKEAEKAKTN